MNNKYLNCDISNIMGVEAKLNKTYLNCDSITCNPTNSLMFIIHIVVSLEFFNFFNNANFWHSDPLSEKIGKNSHVAVKSTFLSY
jgi:hypothetical protein